MITTQPMANFKHRVVRISGQDISTMHGEVNRHVAMGYTIRHNICSVRLCRQFSIYEAYVEKLDEVNELYDPSWRPL